MAGLIKREDIDEVRQRTDIKEVIDGYVTLKSAGVGSYKGLCPFHDERSPSFHVRPQVGTYHCFGCEEGGDVISFLQKLDHITFVEAVEKLAARIGFELRYEDGGGPNREDVGRRRRLLDAHKIAAEFFGEQLNTQGAAQGRRFLQERGFDRAAAEHFGVGFAPKGWDSLLKQLTKKGFETPELKQTGLFSEGSRGIYDRFRGRLTWPIRSMTGETIGFGARRLFDDDQGPKYLNTPETPLYSKAAVLYGIDLAKRDIARSRQLVVVEGYTDVMACHLAGITTAVATCGTAFGSEHIKVARRLLSDDGTGGEVIFTFDGDAAGQKAALRAFEEDQKFVAQTYVAVEPTGADPCELRQKRGDEAVKELIRSRRPLFEFAIKASLRTFDLSAVEGRVQALRASAPVVAQIRDRAMRPAYSRELAGWLGMDVDDVARAVTAASRRLGSKPTSTPGSQPAHADEAAAGTETEPDAGQVRYSRPDPRDRVAKLEKEALEVVIQQSGLLDDSQWERFAEARLSVPAYGAVHAGIRAAGVAGAAPSQWVDRIKEEVPEVLRSLVRELAVTPIPARGADAMVMYCRDILNRLFELSITSQLAEKLGALQRLDSAADPALFQQLNRELMELEMQRRELRSELS